MSSEQNELDALRAELEYTDRELLCCFERRMALSVRIARYKAANGLPVKDEAREAAVLEKARSRCPEALWSYARQLMLQLMSLSRDLQTELLNANNTAKDDQNA